MFIEAAVAAAGGDRRHGADRAGLAPLQDSELVNRDSVTPTKARTVGAKARL